jgi:hypothetical protein
LALTFLSVELVLPAGLQRFYGKVIVGCRIPAVFRARIQLFISRILPLVVPTFNSRPPAPTVPENRFESRHSWWPH